MPHLARKLLRKVKQLRHRHDEARDASHHDQLRNRWQGSYACPEPQNANTTTTSPEVVVAVVGPTNSTLSTTTTQPVTSLAEAATTTTALDNTATATLPNKVVIDNTLPSGTNPLANNIENVTWLGYQIANNSCSHRDLGFAGKLGGKWYSIFGDTLWAAPGVTDMFLDPPGFHGMVRDSISLLTDDPLTVVDLHLNDDEPVPHQLQFVPFNEEWGETNQYGFGGTSLCEVDEETGMGVLYYLVNGNESRGLIGAGVARVELIDEVPTVTHRYGSQGWWWDSKKYARYGDQIAYRDENSEYIYIWGGPPDYITDWSTINYHYLARVKAKKAFDLGAYEYYWGKQKGWRKQVLDRFDTETSVMWGSGQGQVHWSEYWGCYLLVHLGIAGGAVFIRTADNLEGPWTPDVQIFQAMPIDDGLVYAGVAHPYLDETGKTLVVSYTNNNHIEVLRVEFA
ncbi:hypothetical protein QC761_405800 [Podospora bellae-mahoneyi]|uniref:DUF4185 domain-containing protein n=1 Tax=Podospora bellae-mahoneyi TaxID=2093777 RepID=A0ABR0FK64_9PEZI|nr:hypothetical protein QC761_405800 [Podospora bellae-mahoneyi]